MGIASDLRSIGKQVDDEFLAVFMLQGLPASYKPLIMALKHSGADLTSEYVQQQLLSEKSDGTSTASNDHAAFLSNKSSENFNKKNKGRCFNCGNKSHFRNNCPLLKNQDSCQNPGSLDRPRGVGCNHQQWEPRSKQRFGLDGFESPDG